VPERVHRDALVDARERSRLVHDAVQLPGRHGIERIAPGEQPAVRQQLALGAARSPPGA